MEPVNAVELTTTNKVRDFVERVVWTAIQSAIVFLLATPIISDGAVDWDATKALAATAFAVVYNALINVVLLWAPKTQNKYLDLLFRCVKTFVSAFAAVWTLNSWQDLNWSSLGMAAAAGVTAVLAVVKGWIAEHFIDATVTPASTVKADPPLGTPA